MEYEHTQRGKLHYLFLLVAAAVVVLVWATPAPRAAAPIISLMMAPLVVVGFMFGNLTVRDEGTHLAARFGPLRLFYTRIPYANMKQVDPDRSLLIDGWGIHHIPWRGSIYNVWGTRCVRIGTDRRVIRVGSDDVDNLVAFLRRRIERPA